MASSAARNWELTFNQWSQPLGKVEEDKSENAVRAIKAAIAASPALSSRKITTFVQGSYRNRTGVRQESDVDVCVLYSGIFYYNDIPAPDSRSTLGLIDSTYSYEDFREDVHRALNAYFGSGNVTPGDKAFDVHENTYRVDADVVACIGFRHYYREVNSVLNYAQGTALKTRAGKRVTNFPDQQYDNGVRKNSRTQQRFKPMVRIFKKLSCEMADKGIISAQSMKSYLLECLVWNVPEAYFSEDHLRTRFDNCVAWLWSTLSEDKSAVLNEENGIKKLFQSTGWSPDEVKQFLADAWGYTRT